MLGTIDMAYINSCSACKFRKLEVKEVKMQKERERKRARKLWVIEQRHQN